MWFINKQSVQKVDTRSDSGATETRIRVLDIIRGTTVDGPGFRTAIYFSGCEHSCPGCHNPGSWDFEAGTPMTVSEIMEIVREEEFNVTLSGGDPLYHPDAVEELSKAITDAGYTVWLYTGFTLEEILNSPILRNAVKHCEAIVEGRYVESLKDPDLKFRGSSNQRIISVRDFPGWVE